MKTGEKVLLVDDEPRLLLALRRNLARRFDVVTAASGRDGLRKLVSDGPFAVVVSDMAMPGMDGITFLKEVETRAPRAVRMMLTGDGQPNTAAAAVNNAGVFRFLCKPCRDHDMNASIRDAVREYRRREDAVSGDEADTADADFASLAALLGREFRTPLNQIIGLAEQLHAVVPDGGRCRDYARHIRETSAGLVKTVNSLTVLGAAAAGTLHLNRSAVPITRIVKECDAYVAEADRGGRLRFETEIPDGFPDLMVDAVAFRQILFSLLSNAVRFNKQGGAIRLKAALDGSGNASIEIADTGIGMAPKYLVRSLEPFGHAQDAASRQLGGVGTGLPLAKALTELHGGDFKIDSHLGYGTKVSINLPATSVIGASAGGAKTVSLPPPSDWPQGQISAGAH